MMLEERLRHTRDDSVVSFVTQIYRILLDRDPDEKGLALYVNGIHSGVWNYGHVRALILGSDEFLDRHSPLDHPSLEMRACSQEDKDRFNLFRMPEVSGTPGFVTDYIGSRSRISLLAESDEVLDGVVLGIPNPSDYFSHLYQWCAMLRAVAGASKGFAAMELGAGRAPWLAASGVAARNKGLKDITLLGVEADKALALDGSTNLSDNGLDGVVINVAVGDIDGSAKWPRLPSPRNESAGRPLRMVRGRPNESDGAYVSSVFPDYRTDELEMQSLQTLLATKTVWDIVYCDIQGLEADVVCSALVQLRERTKRIVVKTYTRVNEGRLMNELLESGWVLEEEFAMRMNGPDRGNVSSTWAAAAGLQVWFNQLLA